jgi:D-2-hydroxyacid dehydrogenase (NADP+)
LARDVLIVWPEPQLYVERLGEAFPELRVSVAADWEAAAAHFATTEILITHGFGLTSDAVRRMPRLGWIQCLLSGIDQLAAARASRPGVLVTSCRGIHATQMSEVALLHMLALSRQTVVTERNRVQRHWAQPQVVTALERKTVVIVGTGVVGTRLARVCRGLDMTVHAVSRSPRPIEGVARVFAREQLLEAVAGADYLVLALPHEAETHELIGRDVFEAMKPTAFVVNLARGGVVNEAELIQALSGRQIAGAGLDVTATEPLPADSPLWEMDNVFLTPHIAGRSDRYNEQALTVVVPNMERYLAAQYDQLVNLIPGTGTGPV